jgi:hypothetical protein
LDLSQFFMGTLNISIAPLQFESVKPAITIRQIAWTDLHPPEDFSFSPCIVCFKDSEYQGYIYYPHPETKLRHFQDPSVIEVITSKIPGMAYRAKLMLGFDPFEFRIYCVKDDGIIVFSHLAP